MPSSPVLHDLFKFDIDLPSLDGDRNLHGASPIYFNRQAPMEGISLLDPQKRVASASRVSAEKVNMPASSKLKWADAIGSYHYIEVADRSQSLETIVKLIKEEVQRYLIAAGAAKELLAQLSLVGMRQTGPREWQVMFKVRARVFIGCAGY
ncbi:hypothetical protein SISNIDRAFT_171210 [Sistotremastrum niveocremeum HHB9708]|uniref:Uncharacterized protein n=1 Tax=Sistotremastrum niveocremeum HHB9708 TaxID=1314777 RepID=A0A164S4L1_9AGAM|nr:hypothetical protein SISNIDRAFT_171210 [Sistotremastrum niveocremeum HHB9708]